MSLYQQYLNYLNQALPDISGIFANTPAQAVEEETVKETTAQPTGITPELAQYTTGQDFSVYNPDPTRTRTNYINPFPFNPDDNLGTSDYGYVEPKRDGILGLMDSAGNFLKNSLLGRGITELKDMLPVNRRAILENELIGGGVMLDDIGRVVGDINTPEGIMAGYNANMITDKTFDKRQDRIEQTLQDKYGLTDAEIQDVLSGTYTGNVQTDLIDRLVTLNQARDLFTRRNKVAEAIYQSKLDEKEAERQAQIDEINRRKKAETDAAKKRELQIEAARRAQNISRREAERQQQAIERDQQRDRDRGGYGGGEGGVSSDSGGGYNEGNFCFDPNTLIQMADGSEKKIKEIQLGDNTKGGEVTGVFQFKASDEIHSYKGVIVAGSHYVKEDGKFIMVKDSPLSVKIDKIPVVYSLDTTGRRIFIKDIEFADYNGDGIAKGFLANAGVNLNGFDKEVLRQVENRLI